MFKLDTIRDILDLVAHARNPLEVVRAVVPSLQRPLVLNDPPPPVRAGSSPDVDLNATASSLRRHMLALKSSALDDGAVNYAALADGEGARTLSQTARALSYADPRSLDDRQRLAFWLNVYNVLAIHGVIALGIRASVMEVPAFFGVVRYRIGGLEVSLDHIEHGILRRNSAHPLSGRRPFTDGADSRQAWMVRRVDPRIHAALVCSARSCPPIAVYDADMIDEQLERAMRGFVAAETSVDTRRRRIETSAIFRYYSDDFGGSPAALVATLCRYARPELAAQIRTAWSAAGSLRFGRYDWSLNRVGA